MKNTRASNVEQLDLYLLLDEADVGTSLPWAAVPMESGLRKCEVCKVDISDLRSDARFCSPKCKEVVRLGRRKAGKPHKGQEKQCEWCKYPFTLRTGLQKYCSYYCKRRAKQSFKMARAIVAYKKKYPGFNADVDSRRRARFWGTMGDRYTSADWRDTLNRQGHRCYYCGERPNKLERDHVVPIARGGRHHRANIVAACVPCNRSKSGKLLAEWRYLEGRKPPLLGLMSSTLKRYVASNGSFRLREFRRGHPRAA